MRAANRGGICDFPDTSSQSQKVVEPEVNHEQDSFESTDIVNV